MSDKLPYLIGPGLHGRDGPASISVVITRGSDTLVLRAWGLADVTANRPGTAANTYKIGSVNKQFTAR